MKKLISWLVRLAATAAFFGAIAALSKGVTWLLTAIGLQPPSWSQAYVITPGCFVLVIFALLYAAVQSSRTTPGNQKPPKQPK